jgi:putative transposase
MPRVAAKRWAWQLGPAETQAFWTEFLRDLLRRGLSGVRMVIPDARERLRQAIAKLIGAPWQRCRVHFMRNALAHVPRRQHPMVAAAIRTAFVQEDQTQARRHVACAVSEAVRADGRRRGVRARFHGFPEGA